MSNRSSMPSAHRTVRWTGILLLILVLVPGLLLGGIALRAANREEAYIEKQLETALLAEVTPVAEQVNDLLERVEAELDESVRGNLRADDIDLADWARQTPLVGVPFLFQPGRGFVEPVQASPGLSPQQADFLELNLDFFQDRKAIELYQNIATEYAKRAALDSRFRQAAGEKDQSADDTVLVQEEMAERRNQALSEFESNPRLQKQLYDQAVQEGKIASRRLSKGKSALEPAADAPIPTQLVTESRRFSQIVAGGSHGLIPRLVDERLMLLYWRRLDPDSGPENRIVGCAVNERVLRTRLIDLLPVSLTPARILVLLDHAGRPLVKPEAAGERDWHAPFVARELAGSLPRWEVAAYLTDPNIISARARTQSLTIGLLVALLTAVILIGGLMVARILNDELRLAEQKTTFVANVSHELKTPLTSIRLFAEMLRDGRQADPEKQRGYLGIMVSETERLTRLINNVLDFSRQGRGGRTYSRRRIDLSLLCREIVETQGVRLRHEGFAVELECPPEPAWVEADAEAIKQALLNLISNAEKYSTEEKWIRVALRAEGGEFVVGVADHGLGVRPGDAGRIFDEFFRADDSLTASVRGTGLGLTLSRHIARDHGGDIRYLPHRPRGSLFELRLPTLGSEEEP